MQVERNFFGIFLSVICLKVELGLDLITALITMYSYLKIPKNPIWETL